MELAFGLWSTLAVVLFFIGYAAYVSHNRKKAGGLIPAIFNHHDSISDEDLLKILKAANAPLSKASLRSVMAQHAASIECLESPIRIRGRELKKVRYRRKYGVLVHSGTAGAIKSGKGVM